MSSIEDISELTASDHKIILVNGKYICVFKDDDGQFSSLQKCDNFDGEMQTAKMKVTLLASMRESYEAELCHMVNNDLDGQSKHSYFLMVGQRLLNIVDLFTLDWIVV